MLKKKGIAHSVLNAKYHEKEAEIIEQAGRSGAVTIATNMAGRGTDIVLGGNPDGLAKEFLRDKKDYTEEDYKQALLKADEICKKDREKVVSVGGLHILGTERHEARRIDNQLRGRSGRQGDPGFSRFYLSLEDDLMRIFGSDRISGLMNRLGMEEDMPIENKLVSRAIENAQKKVEAHNFDIRKQLLEYDDVMNKQRIEIYSFRREILQEEGLKDRIYYMAEETAAEMLNIYCPEEKHPEEWDMKGLHDAAYGTFSITYSTASKSPEEIRASLISAIKESYEKKKAEIGSEMMRYIEKTIMLEVVDAQWKDHLLAMDHLKEGIGLRGYGQRDPLTEYKKEAFEVFVAMTDRVSTEVLNRIFKIQVRKEEGLREIHKKQQLIYNKNETAEMQQPVRKGKKTGRNDPCPCGSGKKYKKCCGANA